MTRKCLKTDQPCPCGKSSDAFAYYDDGGFCFSCNEGYSYERLNSMDAYIPTSVDPTARPVSKKEIRPLRTGASFVALDGRLPSVSPELKVDRALSLESVSKYGVQSTKDETGKIKEIILPYYNARGELIAQKVRCAEHPKGFWLGDHEQAQLFGMQRWPHGGKKLTWVEGELEVPAVVEMMGDYPCVSLKDGVDRRGQKAAEVARKYYEWFNTFEEIIICFDGDEPGQLSALEAAKVLPAGKVKLVKLTDYKDPGEYLKAGKQAAFKNAFWNAKTYTPAGIVAGTDLWKLISEPDPHGSVKYPWEGVNKMTYGIRPSEMIVVVSGSGVGKSSILRDLSLSILSQDADTSIGLLMMEESVKRSALGLMSLWAKKPLTIPDYPVLETELRKAYDNTVGLRDATGRPRVYLYDHFGSNDIDTICQTVEYLAKGCGCRYIFLDHISILVSDGRHDDERKALDEIATKLRTLVQSLGITLFLVSHLRRPQGKPHEEGGTTSLADIRGTAGIGQLSDLVIGLERNGQHEDPIQRNTTLVRVLKNRFSGLTGPATMLYFDMDTYSFTEVPMAEAGAAEVKNKPTEDKPVMDGGKVAERVESERKDKKLVEMDLLKMYTKPEIKPVSEDAGFDFQKGDEVPW